MRTTWRRHAAQSASQDLPLITPSNHRGKTPRSCQSPDAQINPNLLSHICQSVKKINKCSIMPGHSHISALVLWSDSTALLHRHEQTVIYQLAIHPKSSSSWRPHCFSHVFHLLGLAPPLPSHTRISMTECGSTSTPTNAGNTLKALS